MTTKVQKWGNSLAVRIPKSVIGDLRSGTQVDVVREGNALLVRPAKKTKFTLEDLVSNIDAKHLHTEFDWGGAKGREIW